MGAGWVKLRIALAVLAVGAFTYQFAASRNVAEDALFGSGILRAPFSLEPGRAVVSRSNPGAEAAGLERGDVILELNGQELDGANDVRRAVAAEHPVQLRWLHSGQP